MKFLRQDGRVEGKRMTHSELLDNGCLISGIRQHISYRETNS